MVMILMLVLEKGLEQILCLYKISKKAEVYIMMMTKRCRNYTLLLMGGASSSKAPPST